MYTLDPTTRHALESARAETGKNILTRIIHALVGLVALPGKAQPH